MLSDYPSICRERQKIIVSRDSRSARVHRAINTDRDCVRHFRIDEVVIKDKTIKKCDFLLLNDTKKDAYLIEMKGGHILDAIKQLEKTEEVLAEDMMGYRKYYRIVYRANTHAIASSAYTKFCLRHGGNVKAQTDLLEETI